MNHLNQDHTRFAWIDNAKAIGIFLVVLGHTKGIHPTLKQIIYSFHMPFFFFLSGYLLKKSVFKTKFRKYLHTYVSRLMIPYIFVWLVSYLLWLPTRTLRSHAKFYEQVSIFNPLVGLISGIGDQLYINRPLWFFTCLLSALIIFFLIKTVFHKNIGMTTIILLGFLGPFIPRLLGIRIIWNIDLAFIAVVFLTAGFYVKEYGLISHRVFGKSKYILCIVFALGALWVALINDPVNMNQTKFGNIFLFYIAAFLGIGFAISIAHLIPENILCKATAQSTIIIFSFHVPIFNIFTGVGVILFGLGHEFKNTAAFSLLYTVGSILVCLVLYFILNSKFPVLVGRRHAPSELR